MSTPLLASIALSYLFPIGTVAYHAAADNRTISSVICKEECQWSILGGMLLMAGFTIAYEVSRGQYSLKTRGLPVLALLVGVIGVILFQESLATHTFFSTLVFVSMIAFMLTHLWTHPTWMLRALFVGHLAITAAFARPKGGSKDADRRTFAHCYATGQHAFNWEAAILASFTRPKGESDSVLNR
jgi:hypothetical protein